MACTAVVLTLAALALPEGDDDRILASVELALGGGGAAIAGATGSEVLIELPSQASQAIAANSKSADTVAMAAPAMPKAQPALPEAQPALPEAQPASLTQSTSQTEPQPKTTQPNLAGLDKIPEALIVNEVKKEGDKPTRHASFAAPSKTQENLPWKAVEPVVFTPMGPGEQNLGNGATPADARPAPVKISAADIGKWMKGKATKIMGAERTRPLYHFVLWVEPPSALQDQVAGVSYDFSSPAVQPQSQASSDRSSGFKINAAGLACSDQITVTLRFDDGRVEKTSIDGCALFNKA